MRPGRGPKGDPEPGFALQFGRKSVRAADCENSMGRGLVAPLAELLGECGTVDIVAALVEGDKHGVFRDCGGDRRGLLGDSGRRVARAAFADLADGEAAEAEL